MERGLLVELSPNENMLLRQIARGLEPTAMRQHDVTRLELLALIKRHGNAVALTALGARRIADPRDQ